MADALLFDSLSLSSPLARAVSELGYAEATNIQAQAIPYLLNGRDVIGRSSTGTGKTAAFGIPAVECVEGENKRPQVLVLSPTRELAMQIAREMQKYAKYKEGVCIATVYGGAPMTDQIRLLKRANIVIGTPGRLMDHLRRKTLKLNDIKMVVLDEADEMLSMGFVEDIQTILKQAPAARQTVLFSATMPPAILTIAEEFLTDPQMVDVMTGQETQADIEQTYYYVPHSKKQEALSLLLQHSGSRRAIVFCNTKSMVDELAALLQKQGVKAAGLHGDMTQALRSTVMQSFRSGSTRVLVATDVAARGIDVSDIDAVINFDLPQSFEYYVHRIGRTGRAGKQGVSQTLITDAKQAATLRGLMRFTGSKISERSLPTGQDMMERRVSEMAGELLPLLQQPAGQAAQLLVKRLQGGEASGIGSEQIALALAEKLLGGDSQFKTLVMPKLKSAPQAAGNASPMVTVTANIGRSDRVLPNHFVGAIAEILDIPGSSVGKIDIGQEATRIGLREDVAAALMNHKKAIRINGREVAFTVSHAKRGGRPAADRSRRAPQRRKSGR
ncbi:DEAD/DEAH box helicase [Allofournierella sp.]|uniref:DEAD/DEAH box helicase n=1 Tax=Allofournierella sp. TaxID=1940256 RepID=UPI003AB7562F